MQNGVAAGKEESEEEPPQNGVAAVKEESEEEPPQNGVAAVKEESEEEPPPPAPLFDGKEFYLWSFYRAIIAEFVATFLFLYVTVATVIGHANETNPCKRVGALGIAWSFGGMTFILVYCTAGISGGHINPAITFGLFVARKVSLNRAVLYMVAQCLGAICGAGMVKAGSQKTYYSTGGGGELTSSVSEGFATGKAMTAEIIGTFVVVYIFFSATDSKNNARNAHIHILAPLAIGLAVFMVHLATIAVTGPGINPAKSFGTAVIYGHKKSWDDLWIFWVGPFTGATTAAAYHKYVITNTLFEPTMYNVGKFS